MWNPRKLFTRKKSVFIAVIMIQSVILALEQCVSLNCYFTIAPSNNQLQYYAQIIAQHALFCLVLSFTILFFQKEILWQRTDLTALLQFYLIQGLTYLDYPLFNQAQTVQSMGCFAILLVLLQMCHIVIFPAPLPHQLLAIYFSIVHIFFRFQMFVASATETQRLSGLSSAEQLFNIAKCISVATLLIVYKNESVEVNEAV